MKSLQMMTLSEGNHSLLLHAGCTNVDDTIFSLGYEPNGYFWESIAKRLLETKLPSLKSRLQLDPEAGMFCAYGNDRDALQQLGEEMDKIATEEENLVAYINDAKNAGYHFED